ncbi:hypothetical protein C8R43DRAFT_1037431 [Mycena crocata]|nr:hypothetical protein C8R43DRAFT_1037431 [Mycena crocata]
MSVCSIARRKAIFQARAFSSASNVIRAPNSMIASPEKMRALIAMYHQTETFVTRENLDDKIDEAFTGSLKEPLATERSTLGLRDFSSLLRSRHDAPSVTEWNPPTKVDPVWDGGDGRSGIWSNTMSVRDLKVIEALYGVEFAATGKALPGLDALDDQADELERGAEEDRLRYEDGDF